MDRTAMRSSKRYSTETDDMEYTAIIKDEIGKEIISVSLPTEGAVIRIADAMAGAAKEAITLPKTVSTGFREENQ